MNTNMPEIEFEDQRLRHMIASLTSELASCQATLHRSNAELAERTEERTVAIKALCHIADALLPDSPVESRYAEVAQDAMGACQIIRRMRSFDAAHDAAVTARAKAEGELRGIRKAASVFRLMDEDSKLWHPYQIADRLNRMAAQAEGEAPNPSPADTTSARSGRP